MVDTTPAVVDDGHWPTTDDNPFNPFTQYDEWYAWDTSHGHHTLALLARFIRTSNELSDADQNQAWEDAVEELVELNPYGTHRRVRASDLD